MLTIETVHNDFVQALEGGMRIIGTIHVDQSINVDMRKPFLIMPGCADNYLVSGENWVFTIEETKHGWKHKDFHSVKGTFGDEPKV